MSKEKSSLTTEIDRNIYQRFDERNNVFGRMMYDKDSDFYKVGMYNLLGEIIGENVEGYTHLDFARVKGAWAVYNHFHQAFDWDEMTAPNTVMEEYSLETHEVTDKTAMSEFVKETAMIYGACKAGITEVNEDWLYSHNIRGEPVETPKEFKNAIVMLIEMDRGPLKSSPSMKMGVENGLSYSKMAFVIGCMAQFIRGLGYRAIPMGNDTALSIPLAVQAGLGELGRNGLLITPEWGARVKICKVFTDLPLAHDEPQNFGITEFCKGCKRCAETCEVDAISMDDEPSYDTVSKSNNQGIKRWAVDVDRCYKFWVTNGGDCSTCIGECVFSKRSMC
ncbi:MAG: reductive dehalogenase [Thermoplasmata archaeon]